MLLEDLLYVRLASQVRLHELEQVRGALGMQKLWQFTEMSNRINP